VGNPENSRSANKLVTVYQLAGSHAKTGDSNPGGKSHGRCRDSPGSSPSGPGCFLHWKALCADSLPFRLLCSRPGHHPHRPERLFIGRTGNSRADRAYQAAVQLVRRRRACFLDHSQGRGTCMFSLSARSLCRKLSFADAGEDGMCVDPAALALPKPRCTPAAGGGAQLRLIRSSTTGW